MPTTAKVICVLEDGSLPRGAQLPTNPRVALDLTLLQDFTLNACLFKANGQQIVSGGTLTWTAKKLPTDTKPVWQKSIALANPTPFVLVPADMKNVLPGLYVYDIWYVDSNSKASCVLPLSPLHLEASVR